MTLALNNLRLTTPSGHALVNGLTCTVRAHQRWVLLGANGAGKSTLLAALTGLLPTQGASAMATPAPILNNEPLWRHSPAQLRQMRSWCPQFWHDPFPCTVLETVHAALPDGPGTQWPWQTGHLAAQAALDWLAALDLAQLASADVRTLSGGERQRVALAAAFVQAAPLMLLDEPTAHLDLPHQAMFLRLLKRWTDGGENACIVAVHDLNLAWHLATDVILLDGRGGAIAGPRDEVMTSAGLSAAFGVPIQRERLHDGQSVFFTTMNIDEHP
jgi:iron complex transport system ATP-binding protein